MSSEDEEPVPQEPVVAGGRMPASPLFRPSNLRCVNTLSGHHSGIRAIAWRSNPQRVYTGSYDNTIKVWNLDTYTCEATLEGHRAWVRSLFCHVHEPLLFSGSDDGEVKIWRTDNNTLHAGVEVDNGGGVLAITVDYERAWLLAGCYDSVRRAQHAASLTARTRRVRRLRLAVPVFAVLRRVYTYGSCQAAS